MVELKKKIRELELKLVKKGGDKSLIPCLPREICKATISPGFKSEASPFTSKSEASPFTSVGRELKMVELKQKVRELETRLEEKIKSKE